jgi:TolB-like protein
MRLLLHLAARPGQVVALDRLLDEVWAGVVVNPGSVYQAIGQLRHLLGDHAEQPTYIETHSRRGYRLVAGVSPWVDPDSDSQSLNGVHSARPHAGDAPSMRTCVAAAGTAAVSSPSAAPPTPRTAVSALGPLRWIGGAMIILAVLAVSWAITYYGGASKPAELTSPGVPRAIHSLVVLPLENLSDDKEQEYFADGMTDALITNLAQIGSLRVISRTSAMQFKGSKETLPQIGRDLQVDAVVEGTVARGESRVRITAQQLIRVQTFVAQHNSRGAYKRRKSALGVAGIRKAAKERAEAYRVHIEWALRQPGMAWTADLRQGCG